MSVNRQIILSEYPKGMPQPEHLPLKEGAMPSPKAVSYTHLTLPTSDLV